MNALRTHIYMNPKLLTQGTIAMIEERRTNFDFCDGSRYLLGSDGTHVYL